MKVLAYKILLFSLIIGVLPLNAWAENGGRKYTKEIKREFVLNTGGEVQISNKYGRVEVRTWDKNRVKVIVEIIVSAKNEAAAQKVFKKIDVDFEHAERYVSAETTVDLNNGWWEWSEKRLDYAVNYEIFMPASASLNLENTYGEVYISALSGTVNLNLNYIDYRIDALSGNVSASIQASDGSIGYARNMNLEIENGSIALKAVENLEISSKNTDVTIGKAKLIVSNSSYDTYVVGSIDEFHNDGKFDNLQIGSVEDAFVESSYSDITFDEVNKYLILDLTKCGVEVKKILKGFKEAKLIGTSSSFILKLEKTMPYQLDVSTDHGKVAFPPAMFVTYEEENPPSYIIKGKGSKKSNGPLIKVRMKYGSFEIKN